MATVDERKALRASLLHDLYELPERGWMKLFIWGEDAGFDRDEVARAGNWLVDHGWARRTGSSAVGITTQGIDEYERRQEEDPALAATLNLVLSVDEVRSLEKAVAEVRDFLDDAGDKLDPADRADLKAQLDTLVIQSKSPRVRKTIVGSAAAAALWIADSAGSELVGFGTMSALRLLVHALGA